MLSDVVSGCGCNSSGTRGLQKCLQTAPSIHHHLRYTFMSPTVIRVGLSLPGTVSNLCLHILICVCTRATNILPISNIQPEDCRTENARTTCSSLPVSQYRSPARFLAFPACVTLIHKHTTLPVRHMLRIFFASLETLQKQATRSVLPVRHLLANLLRCTGNPRGGKMVVLSSPADIFAAHFLP